MRGPLATQSRHVSMPRSHSESSALARSPAHGPSSSHTRQLSYPSPAFSMHHNNTRAESSTASRADLHSPFTQHGLRASGPVQRQPMQQSSPSPSLLYTDTLPRFSLSLSNTAAGRDLLGWKPAVLPPLKPHAARASVGRTATSYQLPATSYQLQAIQRHVAAADGGIQHSLLLIIILPK
jgi:hypothetical protein